MLQVTTIQAIAQKLQAIKNCDNADNLEWSKRHADSLYRLIENHMPSGSGFDNGTTLDDSTRENRIVFNADFHHMDDAGYYDGWTSHQVIVTPDLSFGFAVRVTGKNRNDIKNYIAETFHHCLSETIDFPHS